MKAWGHVIAVPPSLFMKRLESEIKQERFRNEYEKVLVNLIYTYHEINRAIQVFLKTYGISLQQFNILRILRGQHPRPSSVNLLKDRMIDKSSDVSRIIDRLARKKLIKRHTCRTDRRQLDVLISREGLEVLSEIDRHTDFFDQLVSGLNKKEARALNSLLDKQRSGKPGTTSKGRTTSS